MPPDQQTVATTPVRRGPLRSTHGPNRAAEAPRITKNRVYIQPRSTTVQSQLRVVSAVIRLSSGPALGQAFGILPPIRCDMGSQNTLKP